jgi:hypothetical protein
MKWSSILVLSALALLVNACEKHPAAQLPPEHATAFGEHAWSEHGGSKHEAKPAGEHAPVAKSEAAAPVAEGKPGEAPKFFPEKK